MNITARRLRMAVVATALATMGIGAPLAAHATLSQCSSKHMCAWGNNNFDWLLANQAEGNATYVDVFNDAKDENDQTDSWANLSTTYTGCLRDNADGTGNSMTMAKASNDPNVSVFNSDMVSSMRTKGGC